MAGKKHAKEAYTTIPEELKAHAPVKINFDALDSAEQKNWIRFSDASRAEGDITGIRPNFTPTSHLVCYYNPQDGKYDLCYPVAGSTA